MQHHVFLSYSRKNLDIMQKVRDDLRASGLRVWTDEGIEPGTVSWKEAIEQAIRKTHMVVTLLSPAANDSVWVQREIDYAEVRKKTIIPVLIAGQPRDAVPFALAGSQFIDVRKNYPKNIQVLQKQCISQLEINDSITLVHRADETIPAPIRRKRKAFNLLQVVSSSLIIVLVTVLIWFSMNNNADIVTPSISPNYLLLRYNSDTLVLMNNSDSPYTISDIRFELMLAGELIQFEGSEWNQLPLRVGRCVQLWRQEFSYLSPDDAPADACFSRVGYQSIEQVFWVNDNPNTSFSIYQRDTILGTCTVVTSDSPDITTCRIDL